MSEDLKINVVKLAVDGSNWITYRDRLQFALSVHRWTEHLTHTTVTATYINAGAKNGMTPAQRWDHDETIIKYLITSSVPDSIFNRIKSGTHVKDVWDTLKKSLEDRAQNLLMDLTKRIQNTKCTEGNVRTHFNQLVDMREQLAALGQCIADHEFATILLCSLPPSYKPTYGQITTAAEFCGKAITPGSVMRLVTDEYDTRIREGTAGKSTRDEASAVDLKKKRRDIKCYNCHKKGHVKSECWAKGGGKKCQAL